MKIAIVNDLPTAIASLRQVLQSVPDYQVVWTARDGAEAVSKCAHNPPDLVLMDLRMPVMDGVEATRRIMKSSPCGILVVTASPEKNVTQVYQAIEHGALDAVETPNLEHSDRDKSATELLTKIAKVRRLLKQSHPTSNLKPFDVTTGGLSPIVAIGSSTGGPKALAAILSRLPADFGAAIAIVQHVDAHFSAGFADWLQQQCALPVRIAVAGDRLEKGTALIAGTNDHLYIKPDLTLDYTPDPIHYSYRPSVDVFFKSLAQHSTRKGTAILLTGMGRDGAEGLQSLKQKGWHTVAQDKESCVVYGMPKAAAELNAAIEILPPDAIAALLLRTFSR